jgi:hypothetical protein
LVIAVVIGNWWLVVGVMVCWSVVLLITNHQSPITNHQHHQPPISTITDHAYRF